MLTPYAEIFITSGKYTSIHILDEFVLRKFENTDPWKASGEICRAANSKPAVAGLYQVGDLEWVWKAKILTAKKCTWRFLVKEKTYLFGFSIRSVNQNIFTINGGT